MTGIVGQDPRGRSGVLNQLSGLGIGKKVEDWETDPGGPYTPLQIGQGAALAGHGTAETNSQLSLSNNAYYDRVNNRWQYIGASEANKINFNDDGIMYFQSASAGSADGAITWSEAMRITSAGKVGIGTDNPGTVAHLLASDVYLTMQASSASGNGGILFKDSGGTQNSVILYDFDNDYLMTIINNAIENSIINNYK